jgi:hypothetical protein
LGDFTGMFLADSKDEGFAEFACDGVAKPVFE